MKQKLLTFALLTLLAACGTPSALFQPTEADVQTAAQQGKKTDLATLDRGYQLFQQNCGGCHALPAPPRHSTAQWQHILADMFPRTKMTEEEKVLVRGYIEARR